MHGGTIEAASSGIEQGATFRVRLPLMIVHPLRDETERVHPHGTVARRTFALNDLRGLHVLAVDDDADALVLLSELLEAAGARVTRARSASEALGHLGAEVPHVVLADLGMPHIDGFQFIEQVRQHPNPSVRLVPAAALTAYARSDDRVTALRAGFQIHLANPIDPAELVTTVAALAKKFAPEGGVDSSTPQS